jgi:hypothetical protein
MIGLIWCRRCWGNRLFKFRRYALRSRPNEIKFAYFCLSCNHRYRLYNGANGCDW